MMSFFIVLIGDNIYTHFELFGALTILDEQRLWKEFSKN